MFTLRAALVQYGAGKFTHQISALLAITAFDMYVGEDPLEVAFDV